MHTITRTRLAAALALLLCAPLAIRAAELSAFVNPQDFKNKTTGDDDLLSYIDSSGVLRVRSAANPATPVSFPIRVTIPSLPDPNLAIKDLVIYLDGNKTEYQVSPNTPGSEGKASVPLGSVSTGVRAIRVRLQWKLVDALEPPLPPVPADDQSGTIQVRVDVDAPIATAARGARTVGDQITVVVDLKDSDLAVGSVSARSFQVKYEGSGSALDIVDTPQVSSDGKSISFTIVGRGRGSYTVQTVDLADVLTNKQGTANSETNKPVPFTISDGPQPEEKGEHIAFPPLLKRGFDPDHEHADSEFKPQELVDTRVVHLYYFRDAHRVVEIINRNLKRLNQYGVSFARDLANKAQTDADDATDTRRNNEALAAQAVQRARSARRDLDKAQLDLDRSVQASAAVQQKMDSLGAQADQLQPEIDTLKEAGPADTAGQARLKALQEKQNGLRQQQSDLGEQKANLKTVIDTARDRISHARADLDQAQSEEVRLTTDVRTTQAREDRLKANQFRLEVNAGKTDPNTYAAANLDSADPVTQCSVSVIGEGVIHIRGPIRGINKIARMIHQIDTPVGQVKVGIHTVQVNGEHGDRMELVYERIDKHIAHSRFLAHETAQIFRKAVMMVASEVAATVDHGFIPPGCEDLLSHVGACSATDLRRIRYGCAFFGGDFVRELYEMDSELLAGDNKLLSIHSMDTLSLSGALFVAAVAKNDVRLRIIQQFEAMVQDELPQAEFDYYRALTRIRHPDPCVNGIIVAKYGRKLDAKDGKMIFEKAARTYTYANFRSFFNHQLNGDDTLNSVQHATVRLAQAMKAQLVAELEYKNLLLERSLAQKYVDETSKKAMAASNRARVVTAQTSDVRLRLEQATAVEFRKLMSVIKGYITRSKNELNAKTSNSEADRKSALAILDIAAQKFSDQRERDKLWNLFASKVPLLSDDNADNIAKDLFDDAAKSLGIDGRITPKSTADITRYIESALKRYGAVVDELGGDLARLAPEQQEAERESDTWTKRDFAMRVLEQSIDEAEQKSVELLEAMRSHVANVDNYLKRLATALEDDINAQFYTPAFQDIRRASRYWDVNLGQIETTTILTNNRAFAKVSPAATMEFDLPARDILITEAMKGGKALATEYGNLIKDPNFLAGAAMFQGQPPAGLSSEQSPLQQIQGTGSKPEFGAALQALIPDPAVYKFETGTGFEIRPVIQPDGHSIVYGFDYMYTTNVREPVRADEKHLGRVKRHFVHTDVQTSSYELREVSKYMVALKASRTAKGVPLLEDVPLIGGLFRPLPSDESSLQQNIILASSVIYPTLYDLAGLRWSPYADEIHSGTLADTKRREKEIGRRYRANLLRKARATVNENIGGDLQLPAELSAPYREAPINPEEIPSGLRIGPDPRQPLLTGPEEIPAGPGPTPTQRRALPIGPEEIPAGPDQRPLPRRQTPVGPEEIPLGVPGSRPEEVSRNPRYREPRLLPESRTAPADNAQRRGPASREQTERAPRPVINGNSSTVRPAGTVRNSPRTNSVIEQAGYEEPVPQARQSDTRNRRSAKPEDIEYRGIQGSRPAR